MKRWVNVLIAFLSISICTVHAHAEELDGHGVDNGGDTYVLQFQQRVQELFQLLRQNPAAAQKLLGNVTFDQLVSNWKKLHVASAPRVYLKETNQELHAGYVRESNTIVISQRLWKSLSRQEQLRLALHEILWPSTSADFYGDVTFSDAFDGFLAETLAGHPDVLAIKSMKKESIAAIPLGTVLVIKKRLIIPGQPFLYLQDGALKPTDEIEWNRSYCRLHFNTESTQTELPAFTELRIWDVNDALSSIENPVEQRSGKAEIHSIITLTDRHESRIPLHTITCVGVSNQSRSTIAELHQQAGYTIGSFLETTQELFTLKRSREAVQESAYDVLTERPHSLTILPSQSLRPKMYFQEGSILTENHMDTTRPFCKLTGPTETGATVPSYRVDPESERIVVDPETPFRRWQQIEFKVTLTNNTSNNVLSLTCRKGIFVSRSNSAFEPAAKQKILQQQRFSMELLSEILGSAFVIRPVSAH